MVDFLKAFPFVSIEDYRWGLSIPMIRIMSFDNSHVNYLTDKQVERRKTQKQGDVMYTDLGIPIFDMWKDRNGETNRTDNNNK